VVFLILNGTYRHREDLNSSSGGKFFLQLMVFKTWDPKFASRRIKSQYN